MLRRQLAFGIGLELDENAAGLVIGGRRIVEARHHIGQRPAGDIHAEQPAALRLLDQEGDDGWHNGFEILGAEARRL